MAVPTHDAHEAVEEVHRGQRDPEPESEVLEEVGHGGPRAPSPAERARRQRHAEPHAKSA